MPAEARLERTEHGTVAKTDGWYVVNVADCRWLRNERFGEVCLLEGDVRFPQVGVNVHVLHPGKPGCHYHSETEQEDFLVLSGECLVLVEEQERPLRAGDFVHCPPGTRHVFVGAGDGPCVVIMMGARVAEPGLLYPVSDLARRHGAGVETETTSGKEAYADCPRWTPTTGRPLFD